MQIAMDTQEGVLAQLARIVGVSNHSIDDVPTEALMVADQHLERAARAGQDGGHERAIGVEGIRRPGRADLTGFDGR
jgi:hypothetical protein